MVLFPTGGNTFFQSVDGALSFVGALVKQTNKSPGGVLSFAGALTKQTNKNADGVLGFTGVLGTSLTVLQSVSGVLSFAGGLVTLLIPFTPSGVQFWKEVWQVFWKENWTDG